MKRYAGNEDHQRSIWSGITKTTVHCCQGWSRWIWGTEEKEPDRSADHELQVYVLDEGWQPVPWGRKGELCAGGVGLARGYMKQPGLTAEKFVPHPLVGR